MNTEDITRPQDPRAGTQTAPVNPWRVQASVLHNGQYDSVIIDRGQLKKAVAASNNHYLFSETGPGVETLVMVGTPLQIMDFLLSRQTHGIENRIKALPDIYMGIAPYKPKDRFRGIFPIGDTLLVVVRYFAGLVDVPSWAALPIAAKDLKDVAESIKKMNEKDKEHGQLLYVKFSYLKEDGMEKIGTQSINFLKVAEAIVQRYKKP